MISITKSEAAELRKRIKGVHIRRTCKAKKSARGNFYAEEINPVLNVLKRIRGVDYIDV